MIIQRLANSAASTIQITTTATLLTALLDTAAGVANNLPNGLDAVDLTVEGGDIRMLQDGNIPTATVGELLKGNGSIHRLRGVTLHQLYLISTTGSNVQASVQVGIAQPGDEESSDAINSASSNGSVGTTSTPNVSTIADPTTPANQANVFSSGQTGENALLTAGAFKEVSFSTTSAQAVASTDVSNFRSVSVQIIAQGTSSNVTFQGCNDNLNWQSIALNPVNPTNGANQTSSPFTGIWAGAVQYRYFRLNITGISAGITSGVVEFYTSPMTPLSVGVGSAGSNIPTNTAQINGSNIVAAATGVQKIGSVPVMDATSTFAPTNVDSVAYEASHILKASSGVLFGINGYNSKTSTQFIQVHNSATLPADTAVPVITFAVAASSNFSWFPTQSQIAKYFSTGMIICNSSTGPTKTIGSADCWFNTLVA